MSGPEVRTLLLYFYKFGGVKGRILRRAELEKLITVQDRRRRTPFYFALVAFGREFIGLESYIQRRLEASPEAILNVCTIASLMYHFAQQSTPLQFLAPVLGVRPDKLVTWSVAVPGHIQELFVKESASDIRPAHELIAAEILEQLLSRGHGERRNWTAGLADAAIDLVDFAAEHHQHTGGRTTDLMRSILIERGSEETPAGPWEGAFSQLISNIPSSDGKQRVLERLTEKFPDEAHFWAHLGRFYTRFTREYKIAKEVHEKATRLDPQDPVLFHMSGMAFRRELEDLLDENLNLDLNVDKEIQVQSLVQEALRNFQASRELDHQSEYNYISPVQMITSVIGRVA